MAWVIWMNRFAGRTIRVEEGQTVITSGPYRVVRHPMYAFTIVMFIFAPLALGSYVTLPAFAMLAADLCAADFERGEGSARGAARLHRILPEDALADCAGGVVRG